MPVEWTIPKGAPAETGAFFDWADGHGAPMARVVLRPHRSLPRSGFAWFLLIVWGFLLIPLIPLLGTLALWAMLPFLLLVLAGLWFFIERNYKDGALHEIVTLWQDRIEVRRINPRAPDQIWDANPYWVSIRLGPGDRPVENYLTLKGNGREIELGTFLSPEERQNLSDRLNALLVRAKSGPLTPAAQPTRPD